jgi:hypothetical protein
MATDLEKEAHGQLRDDETTEEKEIAKKQEELDESHTVMTNKK